MRLVTIIFDRSPPIYCRYLESLRRSAEANTATPLEILTVEDRDLDLLAIGHGRSNGYTQNTRKTRHQRRYVDSCQDGDLVGFLDVDTLILKPLEEIEQFDAFDLAYTMKPAESRLRLNTGVTFCRVSEKVRKFYDRWEYAATAMLRNKVSHRAFIAEYGGINQSSLGFLLKENKHGLRMLELASRIWNCTQDTIGSVKDQAKIVHLLRDVRRTSISPNARNQDPNIQWVAEQWRSFECSGKSASTK